MYFMWCIRVTFHLIMPSRHNLFDWKTFCPSSSQYIVCTKQIANNPIAVSRGSELIFDCCNIGYWCLREAGFRPSVSRKWICIEHLDCCGSFKRHKVIQILHCLILIKKPGVDQLLQCLNNFEQRTKQSTKPHQHNLARNVKYCCFSNGNVG